MLTMQHLFHPLPLVSIMTIAHHGQYIYKIQFLSLPLSLSIYLFIYLFVLQEILKCN